MRGKNARGALGKASEKWLERNYCSTLWIIIKHSRRTKTPIFFRSLNFSSFTIVKLAAGCRPSAEMPTSGDLKSGDFFSDQPSPPSPRPSSPMRPFPGKLIFFYLDPLTPPPPWAISREKCGSICQGPQLVEYSSNQTLLYRSNKEETLLFLFATNNADHTRNWSQKP